MLYGSAVRQIKKPAKRTWYFAPTTIARDERQIQGEPVRRWVRALSRVPAIGGAMRTLRFPEEFS